MSTLPEALEHLRRGGIVILCDDEDRENEGDLVMAAEFATPEAINFMAKHGRGLICLTLTSEQIDRLNLVPMVANNKARRSTAFTVSIEARDGITTGISAFDRAHTIRVASNPNVKEGEIVSPGHVFPLRANDGGVLKRNGQTEGSIDLMNLAGLRPAGVICEIMSDDGQMARRPELEIFAKTHGLPMITVKDIIHHRMQVEKHVSEISNAEMPTAFAETPLRVHAFRSDIDGTEHLALVKYPLPAIPLVRVHSECLTGEALGSLRCDCGPQLQKSIQMIAESEGGVLVYLRNQEGRGIGLANKIRAYALQDQGHDTIDANTVMGFASDAREYGVAAQILRTLGVKALTLLSNNPLKSEALQQLGIEVMELRPLNVVQNPFNKFYLSTKRDRLGHTIPQPARN